MNLRKKNLRTVFFISLCFTLFTPALFPSIKLFFFAPFIIILFYQKPFIKCLWGALLSGLIVDLFSAHSHLGLHAINYITAVTILYKQRKHFFSDSATTLPLMIFFFSIIATLLQIPILYVFEQKISLSKSWILSDLILMPFFDALYGFVFFVLIDLIVIRIRHIKASRETET